MKSFFIGTIVLMLVLISGCSAEEETSHNITGEQLDLQDNKIVSDLNHQLEASNTTTILASSHVLMTGMYQYQADAAHFQECLTGLKFPVIFEADHRALEAAYLTDMEPDNIGKPLKVHLEASIVQRPIIDGIGNEAYLQVDRFIKTMPSEHCNNPYVDASLHNTYWRLTALNGKAIGRDQVVKREAHLVFHTEKDGNRRVSGSTSCNRFSGSYQQQDQSLSFAANMMMTKMACVDNNIEQVFINTLDKVTTWSIEGDYLSLYDEDNSVVARFEATYLH